MSGGRRSAAGGAGSSETSIAIRVRYAECDAMGYAHHSHYPVWFEMARTELLRQRGLRYRDVEASGHYFVVARLNVRYRRPARYDDELTVQVRMEETLGAKLEHAYEVRRGEELIATAQTTLACVDGQGRLVRISPELMAGGG